MPFKSEAQRRYLWAREPKIAREWSHKYGTPKNLPMHKGPARRYKGASKYRR